MKIFSKCDCETTIIKFYIELFGFECEGVEKTECCGKLVDGEVTVHHMPSIIRYIGQKAKCQCYFGRDIRQQAAVDSALERAEAMCYLIEQIEFFCSEKGAASYHNGFAKSLFERAMASLNCLEKFFTENTFLVNDRISIADFYMVFVLKYYIAMIAKADAGKYQNVFRYMNMIAAQFPLVAKMFGAFVFAETAFAPKAFKAEKPAKEEKKEADEPMDDAPKEEVKAIKYNYTMDLNAWKRHYKNLDWDEGEDWQPYFYEHFKADEFSLWCISYKDPENFVEDWKTKNMFSMYLQRLRGGKADQNCFGTFLATKPANASHYEVVGVFMFPGKEIMLEWQDNPSTNSFNFVRMDDWQTPEAKAFIKACWDWSETTDLVYHGKNYGPCSDGNGETFV